MFSLKKVFVTNLLFPNSPCLLKSNSYIDRQECVRIIILYIYIWIAILLLPLLMDKVEWSKIKLWNCIQINLSSIIFSYYAKIYVFYLVHHLKRTSSSLSWPANVQDIVCNVRRIKTVYLNDKKKQRHTPGNNEESNRV